MVQSSNKSRPFSKLWMNNYSYDFPFSTFQFPTDLRFLLLTHFRSSQIFRATVPVTLQPSNTSGLYGELKRDRIPSFERIVSFRAFIDGLGLSEITVSDGCSQHIQDDFVQARKQDKNITAEDLTHWIFLAKAKALLDGRKTVDTETWVLVRQLDERRKRRVSS